MEYTGTGNESVSVTSSVNEGLDYSTTFNISTTDKSVSNDIVVNKEGRREVGYASAGGAILLEELLKNE